MKLALLALSLLTLASCTISMNNLSTEGSATDVIDAEQSATPDIAPSLEIPALSL